MTMYNRRVAERFGADARIDISCAIDSAPIKLTDFAERVRDLHVQNAYDDARLAFHFAALVHDDQSVVPRAALANECHATELGRES